jgi:hypothetical protein
MHWTRSGELIVMVLLGGTGTVYGPVLGAIAFVMLEETLAGLTEHWKAILGPILVLVVLFAKGGLAGAIAEWRRRRTTPAEMRDALAAFARRKAERWQETANARWRNAVSAAARWRETLLPIKERATAHAQDVRRLARASDRYLQRLALLGKGAVAEVRARWHPWKMALGRQLVRLLIRAERGVAVATERWRRR